MAGDCLPPSVGFLPTSISSIMTVITHLSAIPGYSRSRKGRGASETRHFLFDRPPATPSLVVDHIRGAGWGSKYEEMGQERKRCVETVQITRVSLIPQPYSFYFLPLPLPFLSPFFPRTVYAGLNYMPCAPRRLDLRRKWICVLMLLVGNGPPI